MGTPWIFADETYSHGFPEQETLLEESEISSRNPPTLNVCLLLSERGDRIHGSRPPGRNVGRNQSDEGQYYRQQNERN